MRKRRFIIKKVNSRQNFYLKSLLPQKKYFLKLTKKKTPLRAPHKKYVYKKPRDLYLLL